MGFCKIFCSRIVPLLVLLLAVVVGWLCAQEMPMATFFACLFPVLRGYLPPPIFGHGRMPGTPVVPDDMVVQPRPGNELFLELPDGAQMPQNGLGMCCRASAYDDVLVRRTVLWYLLQGGRHIDGAHLYLNHKAIGLGINDAVARGVPREEIFVTTKIFPTHFGYNKTLETVPKFLDELGLDYIDLVLMHFPSSAIPWMKICSGLSNKKCRQQTWKALSELRERGLLRNVGVSNFAVSHLKDVQAVESGAPVANNQIAFNPWTPPHVAETFAYCQEHDIAVTAYSSLGGTLQHAEAQTVNTLQELAAKYDKSVAQIILRWVIQVGAAVIPGTGDPGHMRENLAIYEFELTPEDMAKMDALKHDPEAKKFFYMEPPQD